ncbi:hypothetical protein Tco_0542138, partial [Tanacetum coccineum]
ILKQYQKEVNELHAERIAKTANPLALVSTVKPHQDPYYQTSKSHKSDAPTSKASLPTRSHATTKHKGKEIAKPISPPSESPSNEDSDPEQAQKDKKMQKNLALIAKYFKKLYKPTNNNLRTSSNTRNKNVGTTPRYKNVNQSGQFGKQRTMTIVGARETECRKPKRVKDSTYHKEKMLLCKQAEKGVQLQAEQSDWLADTDEEIDEQELEAHYMETGDSNVIPDSPDMCDNDIQDDQNDVELKAYEISVVKEKHDELVNRSFNQVTLRSDDQNDVECDDERVAFANLIANLKLDVDENKKIQKQLKKANATLTQELTECTSILAETSRTLGESNSIRETSRTQNEIPCFYAIPHDQSDPANRLVPNREETLTLDNESR